MGVPGFVAWLYNNHKTTNFIFQKLFKSIDITDDLNNFRINTLQHFYIDGNCLIHPIARKVYMENLNLVLTNNELLETKIITEIITYIKLLINQVNPTNTLYIAIDGVAPMAKIKHQRLRRFKAIYDKKIMEDLHIKHKKEYPVEWNTSAITPGTIFMDNLTKYIISWIKSTKFSCNVIFSSSYTPGEGEHKILQHIRTSSISTKDNILIYGLDADLLFLSLSLNRPNIYLMRETSEMELNHKKKQDIQDDFSYLSIDILGETIFNITIENINKTDKEYEKYRIINDFIFLCYFCGNDFLPYIPSLNIKPHNKKIPNGIDSIFYAYSTAIDNLDNKEYLIDISPIKINQNLFLSILRILTEDETTYYNDLYNNRRYIKRLNNNDPFAIDKYNYEENIINNFKDEIQLGNPSLKLIDWKYNYYKHYYKVNIDKTIIDDNSLNSCIDDYIKGLVWINHYYFDKCKDYEWYYEHHHGLFISDIYKYLLRFPGKLNIYEEIYNTPGSWFEYQIKPLQQLMLVLPLESSYLIPTSYKNIMFSNKLKKYFPDKITDIKVDYLLKNRNWQNILMIDIIPGQKILKLTKNIILNEDNYRNKLYNPFIKSI
jgi:5'-3' exonuclease